MVSATSGGAVLIGNLDPSALSRSRRAAALGGRPPSVAVAAPEAPLILAGGQTQAALEVAVQVAVIGEPRLGGGRGDRFAGFDQATGEADTVRELQRVGGQTGARAKQADETELADARRGGEFVQADIAFGLVSEIVTGHAERPVVAGAQRRPGRTDRGAALDQGGDPREQQFVALQS